MTDNGKTPAEAPTAREKRQRLFEAQKRTLDTFLAHGAISEADYEKSLRGLMEKMHIG